MYTVCEEYICWWNARLNNLFSVNIFQERTRRGTSKNSESGKICRMLFSNRWRS